MSESISNLYAYNFSLGELIYLDASFNNITTMNGLRNFKSLIRLDLRFNMISDIMINIYENFNFHRLSKLEYINLNRSIARNLINFELKFGNKLEQAILSGNDLRIFPNFCQQDDSVQETLSCNLKTLHFDHNQLEEIKRFDFIFLKNLEYFNLHSNIISSIEDDSFFHLNSLETLILSSNNLNLANNTQVLFNALSNIKMLNLSFNFIEIIRMNMFQNLFKLEVLDLSNNKIHSIKDESFKGLINLRDLYLNGNEQGLKIENSSFNQFEAIKTIFIDKTVLDDSLHKSIFIEMVKKKNLIHNKTILKWSYFQAFNLISLNETFYDCGLVFEFIPFNIQYNLKTESDFSDYLANCQSSYLIRKDSNSYIIEDHKITINYILIFLVMLGCITLFSALIFAFINKFYLKFILHYLRNL